MADLLGELVLKAEGFTPNALTVMNVKIIKSGQDYEQAMACLSVLMSRDLKPGSKEEKELELLALAIRDYERRIVSAVKVDLIESIVFRMDQMRLSRKDIANAKPDGCC